MLPGISPGRYTIRINTPGGALAGWMLKSATANGNDALDVPLEVQPNENVNGVVITFTDQRTQISGTMQGRTGQAASE